MAQTRTWQALKDDLLGAVVTQCTVRGVHARHHNPDKRGHHSGSQRKPLIGGALLQGHRLRACEQGGHTTKYGLPESANRHGQNAGHQAMGRTTRAGTSRQACTAVEHVLPSLNSSLRPLLHSPELGRFAKFMAVMVCAPANCSLIQEPAPCPLVAQPSAMLPSYALPQGYWPSRYSELAVQDAILTTGAVAQAQQNTNVGDRGCTGGIGGIGGRWSVTASWRSSAWSGEMPGWPLRGCCSTALPGTVAPGFGPAAPAAVALTQDVGPELHRGPDVAGR